MEAIQSVVILAVSALVLVALDSLWKTVIEPQTSSKVSEVFKKFQPGGGGVPGIGN
jgi:hypothetical protein